VKLYWPSPKPLSLLSSSITCTPYFPEKIERENAQNRKSTGVDNFLLTLATQRPNPLQRQRIITQTSNSIESFPEDPHLYDLKMIVEDLMEEKIHMFSQREPARESLDTVDKKQDRAAKEISMSHLLGIDNM